MNIKSVCPEIQTLEEGRLPLDIPVEVFTNCIIFRPEVKDSDPAKLSQVQCRYNTFSQTLDISFTLLFPQNNFWDGFSINYNLSVVLPEDMFNEHNFYERLVLIYNYCLWHQFLPHVASEHFRLCRIVELPTGTQVRLPFYLRNFQKFHGPLFAEVRTEPCVTKHDSVYWSEFSQYLR